MKYMKDGEAFDINVLHIIGDVQYPAGWFSFPENRAAMGITEVEGEDETPEPIKVVPTSVTRRQARQALFLRGLLDQVPEKLAMLPDGQRQLAEIEWEDSLEFMRSRPLVIQIGLALGLDSEGLDELFRFASTL